MELQVKKNSLADYRLVATNKSTLKEGEVLLNIEYFAFTANNITYGAAGDMLGYWHFFPVDEAQESNDWGMVPVWGFADIIESQCPELPIGDRIYGYFPPAEWVVMQPQHIKPGSFIDGIAHRQALPPLYNRYQRVLADQNYSKQNDIARMLLSPLHLTSYCIWDHIRQQDWFGAEQVIVISASSKTSLGVGLALRLDNDAPVVIGLTSAANSTFVRDTNLYDAVIAYDEIGALLDQKAAVIVDMAGNPNIRRALQARLGDQLQHYINVGLTHWDEQSTHSATQDGKDALPAIKSQEMFFAPSYILERSKTMAPGEFDKKSGAFLTAAATATFAWVSVEKLDGISALADIYPQFIDGSVPPSAGYIVSLAQ